MSGLGPEGRLVDDALLDAAGDIRDFAELSEEIGDMQAFLALFELELRPHLNQPRARGYPPRVFVSYRRESPADVAWCEKFADALEAAGWEVLLDERALTIAPHESGTFDDLAKFMGLLATADVALVVCTAGFVRHDSQPNTMRNWIFEEWSRITTLDSLGLLEIVLVHRSGDLEDLWGGVGSQQAYIDIRDAPAEVSEVVDFFGQYRGHVLERTDQQRLGVEAGAAVKASMEGDLTAAATSLDAIGDLAFTEEYAVAHAFLLMKGGESDGAREVAIATLGKNPTLPTAFRLAQALWLCDYDAEAFRFLAELAEAPSLWRHEMRFMMGDILERLGHPLAAINQWNWCVVAQRNDELGGFLSSMGPAALAATYERLASLCAGVGAFSQSAAYDAAAVKLQAMTDDADLGDFDAVPLADDTFAGVSGCTKCRALFPGGSHVCVYCGTPRQPGEACGLCTGDPPLMQPIDELAFCPICRKGPTGPSAWGNFYFVPREPKGRWSVLAPA